MVVRLWQVRPPTEDYFDPYEIYANESTLFTLKVFHGGQFIENPGLKYIDGSVGFIDMIDSDEFSVHEFDLMIQKLGYAKEEIMYYYFRIPYEDLNIGLRPLGNDKDVLELFKYVGKYKMISVYTEHGGTTLNTYFRPNESFSSVVIHDILDDVQTVNVDC